MKLLAALLLAALLLAAASLTAAEPQFSDIFVNKTDGYAVFRIPSVVVTKKGTVLAFAEGRKNMGDQAQNKIVLKRSTNGGAAWGALQLIHDDGANSLNNPTALVAANGRVFLMWQRIPAHMNEGSKDTATGFEGEKIYRTFLVTSDDDGATWSKPREVTRGTKRETGATTVCSGPGIGIQLTRGPHKGRLIVPFNEGPYGKWNNYAAYSDDNGATWRCGENVPGALQANGRSQLNEVQMAELSDGSVRLDSRQFGGGASRKTAVSKDGGATWSPAQNMLGMRDPSCMASILRYSFDGGAQGRLLHSGPDSGKRDTGTIYLSTDDGATWPVKRVLWPGGFAYSVLTRFADGTVGCLFEADNCARIVFARFTLDWLLEGSAGSSVVPEARAERTGKFGWWMGRHEEKLAASKAGVVELAFLGDSITQNWEQAGAPVWAQHYAARKAANYGFGGDSTQHVLWRLDHGEWDGIAPKVCVLLIGTNNTKHTDDSPEQIASGIRAILDRLAAKTPQTKVLLLAILPRGANNDDPWRRKCEAVNKLLPALADGQHVHFLDLGAKLLAADGTLAKDIAPDLLHLSAKGYGIWADAMEPKLKELLGEK